MMSAGRVLFDLRPNTLCLSLFKYLGSSWSRMAEFATEKGEESLEDLVALLFSQMRTAPEGWTSELSSDVDPAILDIFLRFPKSIYCSFRTGLKFFDINIITKS